MARLQRDFSPDQFAELRTLPTRKSLTDLTHDLLNAFDLNMQIYPARRLPGVTGRPNKVQVQQAVEHLAQAAVTLLVPESPP